MFVSAVLVILGAAVYPVGWDNREVRESCGNLSHIYRLGQYIFLLFNMYVSKLLVQSFITI